MKNLPLNTRLSRIEQIYERLYQNPDGFTISELAKDLNVSTKTIQRDLHYALSDSGVYCEGRKWKLDASKSKDGLKSDEKLILGILDGLAKNVGYSFYNKAHQLLSQITSQLEHPLFANISFEILKDNDLTLFQTLEEAIKGKKIIEFDYLTKNKHKRAFKLKPLKLAFFDGFWYLLAFDINANDEFKKFHFKSIKNIVCLNENFTISQDIEAKLLSAHSVWFNLDKSFTVRLYLEKEVAIYFERKPFKNQRIEGVDVNGGYIVAVDITNEMEIIPIILWHMPHIKVLEPDWLSKKLLEKVSKFYNEINNA